MKPMLAISICTFSLAACGTSDSTSNRGGAEDGIEIRMHGVGPVSGTAFTCTEHPPQVLTPCYEGRPKRGTSSWSPEPGVIQLGLARSTNEADAGAVTAVIELRFLGSGALQASAEQTFVFESGPRAPLPALGGWIQPVALSPTLEGRNAGWFSVDFEWGTVAGTYDSADRATSGE